MNIGSNMIKIAVTGLLLGSLAVGSSAGAAGMVQLSAVSPQKLGAQFTGHHDSSAKLHISVALPLRDQAGLSEFLHELQDPHSFNYHRFLTQKQFTRFYGPTQAQVNQVEKFLKQRGFTITSVSRGRARVHATASTATVESAFGVAVNDYSYQGGTYYGTATGPSIPADIAPLVTHVFGLENFVLYHSHAVPVTSQRREGTQGVGPQGLSPLQVATAYGWPTLTAPKKGALPAAGVTVAIATAFSFRQADVEHFWATYGLPTHPLTVIPIDGFTRKLEFETTLDVEESSAMSPGSNMQVYEAVFPGDQPFDDMFDAIANAPAGQAPDVVSTSWGEPEDVAEGIPDGSVAIEHGFFQQMAAEGMTFMAASGDNGSGDNDPSLTSDNADFPSSDPFTLAAGGTSLTLDASNHITSEVVWNDLDGAAGGADSMLFAQPGYQASVSGLSANSSCTTDFTAAFPDDTSGDICDGAGGPSRQNSDLAMDADPETGYATYFNGRWGQGGGTSYVAPELAGFYAIVTARLRTAVKSKTARVGQANPTLYLDFQNNPSDFNDITAGDNGQFPAGTGWDHPTGLGTPHNASTMMNNLVQLLRVP